MLVLHRFLLAAAGLGLIFLPAGRTCGAAGGESRVPRIVLIAGPLDAGHPRGTHEYEKSVKLLKHCLDTATNVPAVKVEAHFNGWPRDDSTLNDADTIVVISSGSDRKLEDHPLLVGDRMQIIDKQMKRGCGLVAIHWTTFFPNNSAGDKAQEWLGGHFDYQSGPPPRNWASAIQHLTTRAAPASAGHLTCRGIVPFDIREEFYYKIRLNPRSTPVLTAVIPGEKEPQVVAWAIERPDGGRGFGFTGGHYFDNWWQPNFRRLILNAILWTARAEVPADGVDSFAPTLRQLEKLDRDHTLSRLGTRTEPTGDPDWTPRVAKEGGKAWEKETDKDWVDNRFQSMDTGPFLNATYQYALPIGGKAFAHKGTAIRLGGSKEAGVLFDRGQLRLAAVWTGGYLNHGDRRFGLLNTPQPAGKVILGNATGAGWSLPSLGDPKSTPTVPLPRSHGRFLGHHVHGERVVFSYKVGETPILDSTALEYGGGVQVLTRTIQIPPLSPVLTLRLADYAGPAIEAVDPGTPLVVAREGDLVTAVAMPSASRGGGSFATHGGKLVVRSPAAQGELRLKLCFWQGPKGDLPKFAALVKASPPPEDLTALTKPGPRRWGEPLVTRGIVAPDDGPYVIDTLTVPYDNPFKALMFLSGIDFLPDSTIAVCTAHGDVWLVRPDDRLERITWQRFASGLYQPLGLKVVDGKIHVLERGQITRLHDLNHDGEADFYENFCNDWDTGPGEHSFDTGLETDLQGNFYFFKTGDTNLPTGGCLMHVSKDGARAEVFATGFRHPICLGMSPTGMVTGSDQEGNWMPATRIDHYRQGGFYGDMRAHHRAVPPSKYDEPILWLPREADNSAGGELWVPEGKFGPLAGQFLHLSYGRGRAFLIMRQEVDGVEQGGAVDLGWQFLSGAARGRFRPQDGHLYVVGLDGWQTAALRDGSLQRVRYTGKKAYLPVSLSTEKGGIRLTFSQPLDPKTAQDLSRWHVEHWNYRWSGEYGSKRWSPSQPETVGQDAVAIQGVKVLDGGNTVFLEIPDLKPVMQMQIRFDLKADDGERVAGTVYNTIHALGHGGTKRGD